MFSLPSDSPAPYAVLIFSKAPVSGEVKTRLAKDIGSEAALNVYKAMLKTICQKLSCSSTNEIVWDCYLSASKDLDHPFFSELISDYGLNTHLQSGGDLGKKMQTAMSDLLNHYEKVVIVGGDAISISAEMIEAVFQALDHSDVSLVPAQDGGYIAIAVKKTHPEMFQNIEWGTEQVLTQQLACFEAIDWHCWMSEHLWDLDELEDLQRVKAMPELYTAMLAAGLNPAL